MRKGIKNQKGGAKQTRGVINRNGNLRLVHMGETAPGRLPNR